MKIFSRKEAADYFGVSIRSLDIWRKDGSLKFVQLGGRYGFLQEHLDEFIAQGGSNTERKEWTKSGNYRGLKGK